MCHDLSPVAICKRQDCALHDSSPTPIFRRRTWPVARHWVPLSIENSYLTQGLLQARTPDGTHGRHLLCQRCGATSATPDLAWDVRRGSAVANASQASRGSITPREVIRFAGQRYACQGRCTTGEAKVCDSKVMRWWWRLENL